MSTKQCTDCQLVLDVSRFYFVSKASGKLRGQCKDCMRVSKQAQREPTWTPHCSRCGTKLNERVGSGRRLCQACYDETYDAHDVREQGSHRLKLKPCSLCGGKKDRFERGKLCTTCKVWDQSDVKRFRRFGLTPRDYMTMVEAQDNLCAICCQPETTGRGVLRIDHDHTMPDCREAVRGLICNTCNYNRLPLFNDDAWLLRRAAAYLDHPPARRFLGVQAAA